ncbi:MAG: 5-formyltetrahydrofolate cyclo-ligase [Alphaproteobacteria bacterium]|nr:MAG: 5-formyltetrahydrofolate cyclo-ligase [Alphaproteobacteria bacterium]
MPRSADVRQAPADWPEIRDWRRARRAELISARVRMLRRDRETRAAAILERLRAGLPALEGGAAGFYWAFKGEIDLRGLMRDLMARGSPAALPVVVEKGKPLEFWAWQPRMKMARGIWNIPIPAERSPLRPALLLVPLVGFDAAGYRLGYGGGYYDRTLAAMAPRPLAIGLGFELGRLGSVAPQPHDIPMDAIVTEDMFLWHRRAPARL